MVECRMKLSLKLCNCVLPIYTTLVNSAAQTELPIFCGIRDFACLLRHSSNLTDLRECAQCELSCTLVIYEIDKLSKTDSTELVDAPFVNIEYLTWPIIRYKREVLFGWVDLLGGCSLSCLFDRAHAEVFPFSVLWWHRWTLPGLQYSLRRGDYLLLYTTRSLHGVQGGGCVGGDRPEE